MLVINRLFFFLDVIFSLVPRGYGDLILVMVFTGFVAKFFCCSSLSANHFPYGFPPFFLYFVKIYAISLLIILTFKQRHFLPAGLSPCTFSRDTIQMVFSPGGAVHVECNVNSVFRRPCCLDNLFAVMLVGKGP